MSDDQIKYHVNNAGVYLFAAKDEIDKAIKLLYGADEIKPDYLPVPWIGQNIRETLTDDYSNSDCGPACLAMWLGFKGQAVTVDQVSKATGLSRGYTYTIGAHLITAAKSFGLYLARQLNLTPDMIKHQIAAGNPLVVLVHYGSLPTRFSTTFRAGHWIIVIGADAESVYYNDPLAQDTSGKAIKIAWADFMKAMDDCKIDGNTARQGLVIA